jgi:hypothetical protein
MTRAAPNLIQLEFNEFPESQVTVEVSLEDAVIIEKLII